MSHYITYKFAIDAALIKKIHAMPDVKISERQNSYHLYDLHICNIAIDLKNENDFFAAYVNKFEADLITSVLEIEPVKVIDARDHVYAMIFQTFNQAVSHFQATFERDPNEEEVERLKECVVKYYKLGTGEPLTDEEVRKINERNATISKLKEWFFAPFCPRSWIFGTTVGTALALAGWWFS